MTQQALQVLVLAVDDECADAAREALAREGLAAAVRVELGTAAPRRGPVLVVAPTVAALPRETLGAPQRDFLLLDRVADELAPRVELLAARAARALAWKESAERLRAGTLRLTWAVHLAPTLNELAEAATTGLRELIGAHEVALLIPAGAEEEAPPAVSWTARGGRRPELAVPMAPLIPERPNVADVRWAAAPLKNHERIRTLALAGHPQLISELADGDEAATARAVPVDCDGGVTGALVVVDAGDAPPRSTYEQELFSYLGVQVARAASELRLRERERAARERLHETSAELQRLVDEMDEMAIVVRSIADAVNVGVLFYDTENKPKLHNRRVEELLALTGFDPKTGRSKHVYASDRRTRVKQDKNIISETIEGDQRGLIYWIGDPEGEQRAIVTEAHSITRPGGQPLGSAVVTYDVTDLANAIEIREEYLATVSHELRTPLTSIVGYLDLIEDGYDIDALGFGKEFRTIQRSAEQMLELIRDLLSTSTHDLALRIEPTDVSALLAQSVSAFRPAIAQAQQRLELEAPPSTVIAHVDAARLKQVVDNLISNAVKYSPTGGAITVTLDRDEESVVIAVADNGRGVSKTDQLRLFDRFFRTREAREASIQGVGIGLTIVKAIVDAHGGTISVSSEPGRGSTFTVRVPLRPDATPLPTLPMQP